MVEVVEKQPVRQRPRHVLERRQGVVAERVGRLVRLGLEDSGDDREERRGGRVLHGTEEALRHMDHLPASPHRGAVLTVVAACGNDRLRVRRRGGFRVGSLSAQQGGLLRSQSVSAVLWVSSHVLEGRPADPLLDILHVLGRRRVRIADSVDLCRSGSLAIQRRLGVSDKAAEHGHGVLALGHGNSQVLGHAVDALDGVRGRSRDVGETEHRETGKVPFQTVARRRRRHLVQRLLRRRASVVRHSVYKGAERGDTGSVRPCLGVAHSLVSGRGVVVEVRLDGLYRGVFMHGEEGHSLVEGAKTGHSLRLRATAGCLDCVRVPEDGRERVRSAARLIGVPVHGFAGATLGATGLHQQRRAAAERFAVNAFQVCVEIAVGVVARRRRRMFCVRKHLEELDIEAIVGAALRQQPDVPQRRCLHGHIRPRLIHREIPVRVHLGGIFLVEVRMLAAIDVLNDAASIHFAFLDRPHRLVAVLNAGRSRGRLGHSPVQSIVSLTGQLGLAIALDALDLRAHF